MLILGYNTEGTWFLPEGCPNPVWKVLVTFSHLPRVLSTLLFVRGTAVGSRCLVGSKTHTMPSGSLNLNCQREYVRGAQSILGPQGRS